jgi:cytochrome c556
MPVMFDSKYFSAVAVTALLSFSSISQATEGPCDGAIKARQAMMDLYGFNVGILSAMAKHKMPYDAAIATEAAANLSAAVTMGQSQMRPEGSDSEADGNAKNRALPGIWTDTSDYLGKMDNFKETVAALTPVAGDGLDALKGALGDVGSSCKACHDDCRADAR